MRAALGVGALTLLFACATVASRGPSIYLEIENRNWYANGVTLRCQLGGGREWWVRGLISNQASRHRRRYLGCMEYQIVIHGLGKRDYLLPYNVMAGPGHRICIVIQSDIVLSYAWDCTQWVDP